MERSDSDPGRSWNRVRGRLGLVLGLIVLGIVLWTVLWSIERPRARYDTLWYATFTYQDAGVPVAESWDRSYELTVTYGASDLAPTIHRAPNGSWFSGWDDPTRQRWIGIYRMRPLMPLLGAAAFPVLGTNAPLVVGVVAVVIIVLAAALVLPALAGWLVAGLFLLLTAANPLIAQWLVFLMPDGLGIALWFLALALLARYVRDGGRSWLVGATGATLLVAFTRPSALVIPLTMAICAAVALISRRGPWRRFATAAALTTIPIIAFTGFAAVVGYPSLVDQLQDLPTRHFELHDLTRRALFDFISQHDLELLRALLASLPGQPLVWLSVLGAGLGFFLTRQWWTAPFVVAVATMPLLVVVHPVSTEVARTLTPAWISLNLGLALLAATAVTQFRTWRSTRVAPWTSRQGRLPSR